jgi:hypothetical protein
MGIGVDEGGSRQLVAADVRSQSYAPEQPHPGVGGRVSETGVHRVSATCRSEGRRDVAPSRCASVLVALSFMLAGCTQVATVDGDSSGPGLESGIVDTQPATLSDARWACEPQPIVIGTSLTVLAAEDGERRVARCPTRCPSDLFFWMYYRLTLAAGADANVIVVPHTDSLLHLTVEVLDDCASSGCLDSTSWEWDWPITGTVSVVQRVTNTDTAARDYVVAVGACSLLDRGAYTLSVDDVHSTVVSLGGPCDPSGTPLQCMAPTVCAVPSPTAICSGPDVNSDCAHASEVGGSDVPGSSWTTDGVATALGAASTPTCDTVFSGKQHYYWLSRPGGSMLRVRVVPSASLRPILRIFDSCTATSCAASVAASADGDTIEYLIADGGAVGVGPYIVSVGALDTAHDGTYALTLDWL